VNCDSEIYYIEVINAKGLRFQIIIILFVYFNFIQTILNIFYKQTHIYLNVLKTLAEYTLILYNNYCVYSLFNNPTRLFLTLVFGK